MVPETNSLGNLSQIVSPFRGLGFPCALSWDGCNDTIVYIVNDRCSCHSLCSQSTNHSTHGCPSLLWDPETTVPSLEGDETDDTQVNILKESFRVGDGTHVARMMQWVPALHRPGVCYVNASPDRDRTAVILSYTWSSRPEILLKTRR